jgi:hypothetical protein
MIAYYERDGAQPPGAMLVELAQVLRCSTDALLGVTAVGATLAPKTARLLKRLQRIEELPPADQRAVLKLVRSMPFCRLHGHRFAGIIVNMNLEEPWIESHLRC